MVWLAIGAAALLLPLVGLMILWLVGERGHLALPSTRAAFSQRSGQRGPASPRDGGGGHGSLLNALHGYVYGRWPFQYIGLLINKVLPRFTPRMGRWWADHYHGKVIPTELACAIIELDHDIPRRDLEQVIPYPTARDLVLKGPPGVTLMECPCRHAREHPCTPTDVCMIIGEGAFVTEHHPHRSRRVTQREALELLHAEHERGHVHTAYFKDACDNRFYAICNCCKCCCGGLEAMVQHGVPMVASSGFVAEVDELACIACGDCADACAFGAIAVNGTAAVHWESCMGCGVCVGRCSTESMRLVRDERKGIPLDVREITVEAAPV